mgnify:CR=1 FL=1
MLENIKKAQEYEGKSIAANVANMSEEKKKEEYAKREEEIKQIIDTNDDGSIKSCKNTGVYKYSEKYATYVEIKGSLEIEHANGIRVAYVTYRIHLGGGILLISPVKEIQNIPTQCK